MDEFINAIETPVTQKVDARFQEIVDKYNKAGFFLTPESLHDLRNGFGEKFSREMVLSQLLENIEIINRKATSDIKYNDIDRLHSLTVERLKKEKLDHLFNFSDKQNGSKIITLK